MVWDKFTEFKRYCEKKDEQGVLELIDEFEDTKSIRELMRVLREIDRIKDMAGEIRIHKERIIDGISGLYFYEGIGT